MYIDSVLYYYVAKPFNIRSFYVNSKFLFIALFVDQSKHPLVPRQTTADLYIFFLNFYHEHFCFNIRAELVVFFCNVNATLSRKRSYIISPNFYGKRLFFPRRSTIESA